MVQLLFLKKYTRCKVGQGEDSCAVAACKQHAVRKYVGSTSGSRFLKQDDETSGGKPLQTITLSEVS